MKFQFHVHVSDDDYLDYNKFWMIRSHYGKKQMTAMKVALAVLLGACILILLYANGFTRDSFIRVIPLAVLLIAFECFLAPLYVLFLKGHLKSLKKKGKMGYSPTSVMEFWDDSFIETTPDNKTEQRYSAIERISIVDNKMLYIHVNTLMAYMLPFRSFESKEQYDSFLAFMQTKCVHIDIY